MMTLKEIIKKYGVTATTFAVTLDSYRRLLKDHSSELAAKDAEHTSKINEIKER
jgi:aspartate/glutamate racemase